MIIRKLWQKKPTIFVVSGLPRSGTSLMMQMLISAGIPPLVDGLRPADENNPRGYYEYEPTKRLHMGDTSWVAKGRGKVVKIISHQLKYLPDNENYKIIFMRRPVIEIVNSQKTMLTRQNKLPESWQSQGLIREYEQHLIYIARWLENKKHMAVLFIPYSKLIELSTQIQQAQSIRDFLGHAHGKPIQLEALTSPIDAQLYRHRTQEFSQEE